MNKKYLWTSVGTVGLLAAAISYHAYKKPTAASNQPVAAANKVVAVDTSWRANSLKSPSLKAQVEAKPAAVVSTSLSPEQRTVLAAAVNDWKALRQKVVKTPEEKQAWDRSLTSESYLKAVGAVLASPETSSQERLDSVQVLLESLAQYSDGPAKNIVYGVIVDGSMDRKQVTTAARQVASEDRSELLFHYLALFPQEKEALQGKLTGQNASIVYRNVIREHQINIATSQRDTLGRN